MRFSSQKRRQQLLHKLLFIGVVAVAFIDGILFARHMDEKQGTQAAELTQIEDVFQLTEKTALELPKNPQIPEQEAIVPAFTTQAPLGWFSPWTFYAEEASIAMAMNSKLTAKQATEQMQSIAAWHRETHGTDKDNSAEEVLRTLREHLNQEANLMQNPTLVSLVTELDAGSLILAPINGQRLANPQHGTPGPEHHMILIYGYNEEGFLTHDPGTSKGRSLTYEYEKILESIQDLNNLKQVVIMQPSWQQSS